MRESEAEALVAVAGAATPGHGPAETVIGPPKRWEFVDFRELWRFRELTGFLAWRDVKVRYKQTLLGVAWAVLQPVLMMAVFTIFFGRLAGVPSGGVPYPLFAFAGLLPWTFFSTAVSNAGNSVIGSERLITKIYFPRLAIPFAAVGAALLDFVIAFGLLAGMMAYYGVGPGPGLLLLPLIMGLITLAALGVGTLLAALNVSYRDFRYVIPFLMQLWMFATPTVYMQVDPGAAREAGPPASAPVRGVPGVAAAVDGGRAPLPRTAGREHGGALVKALLDLNPMTGLIGSFRAAVLRGPTPWSRLGASALCAGAAFVVGCLYFRKVEDRFADVI